MSVRSAISGGSDKFGQKLERGVKAVQALISPNKNRGEMHFEKVICQ